MENQKEYQKKFNACLMETLDNTMKYFEKYGLRYWIAYGSAIGAVRHHGMVPWDDDIDILMFREDYNKLLSLKEDIKSQGLSFVSHEDEGYYFPFGKVFNNDTTLWETKRHPFLIGVSIDIFPIDRTNLPRDVIYRTWNKFGKIQYNYLRTNDKYSFRDIMSLLFNGKFRALANALKSIVYSINRRRLHDNYIQFEKTLNCVDGDYYVLYVDKCCDKYIYKKEWFEKTEYVDFENLKVPIPCGNHEILTLCYGDYMTPPPVSEQTLSHDSLRYYINLKERLTMQEVKERIKQGKKYDY